MAADGQAGRLERVIEELPNKPFLVGEEGISMSLAGAQTKLAVAVDDTGRVCIPMNGSPSTHILKPDSPAFWAAFKTRRLPDLGETHENPDAEYHHRPSGNRTYLLMQRYDRTDAAPLASLAPGGLLPGARDATLLQVRVQPDRIRGRHCRTCLR